MKKGLVAMGLMMALMVFGVDPINGIFGALLGGGIQQSYIYPIYAGIVVLTGVIVVATEIIVREIKDLKDVMRENNGK